MEARMLLSSDPLFSLTSDEIDTTSRVFIRLLASHSAEDTAGHSLTILLVTLGIFSQFVQLSPFVSMAVVHRKSPVGPMNTTTRRLIMRISPFVT